MGNINLCKAVAMATVLAVGFSCGWVRRLSVFFAVVFVRRREMAVIGLVILMTIGHG
jgi:hypothetical protein